MRLRYPLTTALLSIVTAAPVTASVLSASAQAVGTRSSKADYLQVVTVQDELNRTMKEMNEEAGATDLDAAAPNTGEGGYILEKEGDGGTHTNRDFGPTVQLGTDGREGGRLSLPSGTGRGSNGIDVTNGANINRGNRGGRGRHGGGAHATPEPSTWMLLGAGLMLLGGYATMRRREHLDH